jgi:hypothetical protein
MEHVLGLEYNFPHKIALVAEVPFVEVDQTRKFGAVAGNMDANGLGDIRVLGRYWLKADGGDTNIYLAAGLRAPTGKSNGKFVSQSGTVVTKDLTAQPGTGNLAWIIEAGGNSRLSDRLGMGYSLRYVMTPSETTVNNFRNELSGNGPAKNSDSDALTSRLSFSTPLSLGTGLLSQFSAQGLIDFAWVPYDDLIGGSDGFRRAGPILAVGPGLTWSPMQSLSFSAAVPIKVYRDVQRNGGNVQEWMLQLSVSWNLFGGSS